MLRLHDGVLFAGRGASGCSNEPAGGLSAAARQGLRSGRKPHVRQVSRTEPNQKDRGVDRRQGTSNQRKQAPRSTPLVFRRATRTAAGRLLYQNGPRTARCEKGGAECQARSSDRLVAVEVGRWARTSSRTMLLLSLLSALRRACRFSCGNSRRLPHSEE